MSDPLSKLRSGDSPPGGKPRPKSAYYDNYHTLAVRRYENGFGFSISADGDKISWVSRLDFRSWVKSGFHFCSIGSENYLNQVRFQICSDRPSWIEFLISILIQAGITYERWSRPDWLIITFTFSHLKDQFVL